MPALNNSAQQRHILVIGFTLLFCVSLAIILFERVQTQETAALPGADSPLAMSDVRGGEIIRDQAIALYHSQARQIATLLFNNISRLEQGQAANSDELAAARQAIVNTKVPSVYQKLHFKLLQVLNKLAQGGAENLDYLTEQQSLLKEEFSWLWQSLGV